MPDTALDPVDVELAYETRAADYLERLDDDALADCAAEHGIDAVIDDGFRAGVQLVIEMMRRHNLDA